jgi:hypothetical protein
MRYFHRAAALGAGYDTYREMQSRHGIGSDDILYKSAACGLDITPIGDAESSRDRLR